MDSASLRQYASLSATERWTAILTVVIETPRDADRLRKNPLGVYVHSINWSKELGSRDVSAVVGWLKSRRGPRTCSPFVTVVVRLHILSRRPRSATTTMYRLSPEPPIPADDHAPLFCTYHALGSESGGREG